VLLGALWPLLPCLLSIAFACAGSSFFLHVMYSRCSCADGSLIVS
jgi:hypothetical protein